MREILFRGKRTYNGEWVIGSLLSEPNKDWARILPTIEVYNVEPKTVGQYIGLTDKNGKKIFEGDILHLSHYLGVHYAQIVFTCERFCLVDAHGDFLVDSHWIEHNIIVSSEIVGNIYDNPELLKGD